MQDLDRFLVSSDFAFAVFGEDGGVLGLSPAARQMFSKLHPNTLSGADAEVTLTRMMRTAGWFEPLVESSPNPILLIRDHKLVYANQAALALFDYANLMEIPGREFARLVSPEQKDDYHAILDQVARSTMPHESLKMTLLTRAGNQIESAVFLTHCAIDGAHAVVLTMFMASIWQHLVQARDSYKEKLEKLYLQMESQSSEDSLTGLITRRKFLSLVRHELNRAKRYDIQLSLVLVDIDDLARTNQRWGTTDGDRVLQDIARLIRDSIRDSDVACRFGSDEFLILLPHTSAARCRTVMMRFRRELFKRNANGQIVLPTAISIGWASFNPRQPKGIKELFGDAQKRLTADRQVRSGDGKVDEASYDAG